MPVLAGSAANDAFPGSTASLTSKLLKYNHEYQRAPAVADRCQTSAASAALPFYRLSGHDRIGCNDRVPASTQHRRTRHQRGHRQRVLPPNVNFVSRHLIKFLVTSTPTPTYVQRVATVFNDNGSGIRGDMKSRVAGDPAR